MARKTLLFAVSLLSAVVSAQTSSDSFSFLPSSASSTFPECGLSCNALLQAQTVCVPPQAAVTNDQTYISCFCQSSYLTSLTSSGAVCSSCSAADQQLLVNWYNGYCAGGYTSTLTATATTTSSTNTATDTAAATTTTGTAAAASTSSASSSSKSSGSPGWFSTHWRWVVMLIVLAVAFTALGVFGTWYKKRHDARRPGLYHGDDRRNITASGGHPGVDPGAAGFFSGSLRNLSKAKANSINNPSTTNSSSNNIALGFKSAAAATTITKSKRQPSMSMIRSSIVNNNDNKNNNNYNNNNNNNNQMWGPQQATAHTREFNDITPVDGTAFRNSMAAAAAAAAADKSGTMTTTTTTAATNNGSRTDISSIGTGGGSGSGSGSVAAGRAPTPRSNTNPNRLSKLSVQSSSTLQRQTSSNTLQRGPTARSNDLSPVSPINDDE
ncbi:hypothetical protein UA08_02553 [Talaromyces atroroseus]|uniref:Integral membrane protein n=1 Tax=Talaromyces atroroseus TaxID=1441469 RepID=A0A225ALR1_TALAT|nr:hypothetical protein UA08_02553 [Talaromyces atroroseus]OKL62482.1 hypothetical protein UA08_02553 [Talaromyces atroroseus]